MAPPVYEASEPGETKYTKDEDKFHSKDTKRHSRNQIVLVLRRRPRETVLLRVHELPETPFLPTTAFIRPIYSSAPTRDDVAALAVQDR